MAITVSIAAGTNPLEGVTQGLYTITLDGPAPVGGLTVNYGLAGTATNGTDYTLLAGTNITAVTGSSFTIAEGQTTATLRINTVDDGLADPGETVRLTLLAGTGYSVYNASQPFIAASPVSVGNAPLGMAVGDFNKDGNLDIVTANSLDNNVSIRFGDGLGGFSGSTSFGTGTYPMSVVVGDFNKDGNLDIATGNFQTNNVSILLGNGAGGFGSASNFAAGTTPRHLAMGDFNKDGNLDLVTANPTTSAVSVLLGNGAGGFGAPTSINPGSNPYAVAVGDFNKDGNPDLVTANYGFNNVAILLGNGTGGFGGPSYFNVGTNPQSVVIGDFNKDGNADLAVANNDSNSVSILLGNGAGGFGSATNITVRQSPYAIALGDFNKDGNTDILVSSSFVNDNISILLGNGSGGFGTATTLTVGQDPASIITGDFNGDGSTDFIVASQGTDNVSVLLNNASSSATLTIVEPVVVNLSVSSATGTEAGTTLITVTATAAGPVSGNQTVSLGVSGTGITAGDYTLSNGGVITILNGQTTGSITFTVVNDDRFEGSETATLTLSNPSNGLILGTATQTIAITDDDPLTVTMAAGTNPAEGSTQGTYLFTLNGPAPVGGLVVSYSLGGTTSAADFTLAAGSHVTNLTGSTFTIAEGQTSATLIVNAINDAIVDPNETIALTLGAGGDYVVGSPASASLTVTDAPVVNLAVTSTTGSEAGVTVITVTARAASPVVGNQTMTLGLSGAGITAGDYTLSNTTITILDGQTTGSAIFTVVDDALIEGTETVTFTLSNPSGGIVLGTTTQTVAITDNDFPIITVAPGTTPAEGSTPGTYTITLSGPAPAGGLTVNYGLTGTATNSADYTLAAGSNITNLTGSTFTIAAGQTTATLIVNAINDGIADFGETARLDILIGTGYIRTYNATDPFRAASPVTVGSNPYSVAIGDFNGDGNADIAVANSSSSSNSVSIRLGDGQGGFTGSTNIAVGSAPNAVAIGDFNGDGRADFAAANRSSSTVSIRLGNGNGTFNSATDVAVGGSPQSIAIGDFNGDGRADLATANNGTNTVSIRLGNGNGTFSSAADVAVGGNPWAIAIGDFNGDGRADFATANPNSNNVSIRLGNGNGTFSSAADIAVGSMPRSVATGDFNGDGNADLAVANTGAGNVSILLGNGNGTFSSVPNVSTGSFPFSVAIGDFDGDGKFDLAVANSSSGTVSIRLGNGDGTFSGTTNVAAGTNPVSVALRDFNGDGKTDIVTANTGSGNASVLLNSPPSASLTIINAPTVNLSVSTTAGTEADTTVITVTAMASGAVVGNQTVSLGVSGTGITTGDYSLSNSTITILSGQTSGSVTFTVVNDAIAEGTETATLTISNPSAGISLGTTTTQTITITDNDTAGVIITQSGGTTAITEGGATDTYTVVLNSQPTEDVTIAITNSNQTSTAPTSLTFTAANWNVAQTVTLTAVDDGTTEGNHTGTITHTATSTDTNYNGITIASVTASITDNDTPPTTANTSATLAEDTVFAFNSGLFPFADVDAGDTLQGIRIAQLPGTGQLFLDANGDSVVDAGEAVTAGQDIALASIGQLKFKPAADANGIPHTSFQFQVSDGRFRSTAPSTFTLNVTPVNDNPSGTVTILGTATQGQTLTANNDLADVDNLGNLSYQWEQSSNGTTWSNIATATAPSFTLTQAQVGQVVRVRISYTDGNNTPESVTSAATSAVTNINDLPSGTVTITGTATQGQTLTASDNIMDLDGLGSITYTWYADGTSTGLTGNTYTLAQADVGKVFTVKASYTDGFGQAETVTSTPTNAVLNLNDAPTGAVTLSGEAKQGYVLTANTSTLADVDGLGTFIYQWQQFSNGQWSNISAATNAAFTLTPAQVGQSVRVQVSYTDGQNTPEQVFSQPTTTPIAPFKPASDFNGDGQTDILWRNAALGSTVVWGMSSTTIQVGQSISPNVDGSWRVGAVADFDRNGSPDLLWQNTLTGDPVLWLFDGLTVTSGVELPKPGAAWQVVGASDFSGDGQADILWRNATTGENVVWQMNSTQITAGIALPTVPTNTWAVKAVGDFSRDGQADILWRNSVSGETVVWLMEGGNPVGATTLPTVPVAWEIHGAADFTGDTHLDLLWHNQTTGEVVIWAMQGLTPGSAISLPSVDPSWEAVL